jgi:hypothetical protein
VYYIVGNQGVSRGGHRHHKTIQCLTTVHGSCIIDWNNGKEKGETVLDSPQKLLLLDPEDWHVMRDFSEGAVLLVLASEHFNSDDYIDDGY